MNTDKLREAAEVLRQRAEAATQGPWWNDASLNNVIFAGNGSDDDVAITEDFDKKADADYIATMHPAVGLALANWIEFEIGFSYDMSDGLRASYLHNAACIADLILGGAS